MGRTPRDFLRGGEGALQSGRRTGSRTGYGSHISEARIGYRHLQVRVVAEPSVAIAPRPLVIAKGTDATEGLGGRVAGPASEIVGGLHYMYGCSGLEVGGVGQAPFVQAHAAGCRADVGEFALLFFKIFDITVPCQMCYGEHFGTRLEREREGDEQYLTVCGRGQ